MEELERAMEAAAQVAIDLHDVIGNAPIGVSKLPEDNRANLRELRKVSREARALLDKLNRVIDPLDLSS